MGSQFDLNAAIRKVPDFPKKGILFYDITSILADPPAFKYCIDAMIDSYRTERIDAVAAIESRGFVFAAPFADRLGIPLILIRKKGKLPGETISRKYQLEYGEAEIEVHQADVPKGKRVLVVDDLIATGGTLKAATDLVVAAGAQVAGIFGVVGLPFLNYRAMLGGIPIKTLVEYHGE